MWEPCTGATFATLDHSPLALAWSPDGTRLATRGRDRICLWDPTTGQQSAIFTDHGASLTGLAWSPDGTHLATVSGDGFLTVRGVADNETRIQMRVGPMTAVAWSPVGIAVAGPDVLVVDIRDAHSTRRTPQPG